jgi:hypothetical protein
MGMQQHWRQQRQQRQQSFMSQITTKLLPSLMNSAAVSSKFWSVLQLRSYGC